ncbi:MAG: hypothetical protein A2W90_02665 [Bacteroidetes bacterium GWF2_42_66]|nr:MAG: hypothetical protein A2W92_19705 [Bacteroidetes bacterium GWA2_42_15]OFY01253.1 MAG: hypothetical protein A2W89_16150 [Bacteroidetes bacterium GWE2_42_39]OFY42096.1 MAG: hypothetical protein A2W90_02665 [Bacteroidetes bacterium GWF2_42_66]HBL77702.1 hypothetical protein [Prolixibacteraceae bacterium]HCB62831.1 hypothetical protein [Bacteroidales bacterium]
MRRFLIFIAFIGIAQISFAQQRVVEFIKAGAADANKLFQPYLEPYAFALGDGLNNGWYNSAETHKLFGFDLAVSVNAVQIPSSARTFDLSALDFTSLHVASGSSIAQTIAGEDIDGPTLIVTDDQGNELASFKSPPGTGLDLVPIPMAQITFGVLPNTDLSVRYVPTVNFSIKDDDGKIGMIGAGIKHNFIKSIPGLKSLPLDAAVFIGYSKINTESGLTFTPQDYGSGITSVTFTNTDDQMLKISSSSLKYGLIVSKKLGPLTVFGSVSQNSSKSTVDLLGKYPVVTALSNGDLVISDEDALYDPIALKFDNSNISMDAGVRLKLAFFSLFGSVSKSEYTSFNAGVSLGFR